MTHAIESSRMSHADPGRRELLYARQKVVVTSKAFGLQAIDLVYIDYKDTEGLRRQAREGALMGFTGPLPSLCERHSSSNRKITS
ncbi:hypothetical protein CRUP_005220 [Coryphaenoides rupestris]|nr:hypothetical protein CRUP_005220 [Coryphaenoides rupestris]